MQLSIVIPTYNEMETVKTTAAAIKSNLTGIDYEIVFVDDSIDDTPRILNELSKEDHNVRYEHRTTEKGLGTAVVRGFQLARAQVIAVMDADLQHPPEMLKSMLQEINKGGASVVIPSRFVPGGDDGGLKSHRKVVSAVARYMGKLALKSLRRISDPTGGFFMFRREVIEGVKLKPIGWKILIEVLARGNVREVSEIPYRFQPRHAGESKMSIREQWNYIKHLFSLVKDSPEDRRFYLFAAIGMSGVIINMAIYSLLVSTGLAIAISGAISAVVTLLMNFILNDRITWSDSHHTLWHRRAGKYIVTSLLGICINIGVLSVMYHGLRVEYLLANFIGILLSTIWNYIINNRWTFGASAKKSPTVEVVIAGTKAT